MPEVLTVTVDGVVYQIGGNYSAGTNITIQNGVISAPNVYTKSEVDAKFAAIVDGDELEYGSGGN